jgi:hypothetical protein
MPFGRGRKKAPLPHNRESTRLLFVLFEQQEIRADLSCLSVRRSAVPPFRRSAVPPFRRSAVPPFRRSAVPPFRRS